MSHFLAGALLGLSLAAPPGPIIAVMATEAIRGHSRASLLTAAGAISADAVWLGLVVLGFIAFLGDHPRIVGFLGLCGAELLLWMAWGAFKSARRGILGSALTGSYKLGFLTVLTSPFSFAWWLANGTVVIASWGWAGVVGLFLSLMVYSVAITYGLVWLGGRMRRAIVGIAYASVVMLAGFGIYVGVTSVKMLFGHPGGGGAMTSASAAAHLARETPTARPAGAEILAARQGDAETPLGRPVHTYSIVARDPDTGEIGVAVQSHWFSVGPIVPWAEAGVGAVATQSFVDPSYGPLGLALMRAGKSAPEALAALLAGDSGREVRQVAMIDARGRVAAHTGKRDIAAAGHIVGEEFSVQANLMLNDTVWPAMAKAYTAARGDLAERMLAALDAAQRAGGDIRGRQSAALIVVSGEPTGRPWQDRVFDVRVDDSPDPLGELRRLVTLARAYNHMNAGDLAVEKGDHEGALIEYGAAEAMAPDNAEMIYWHAVALVNMGRVDESLPLFRRVFAMDPNWATLTPRLTKAGLLPDKPAVLRRILAESGPGERGRGHRTRGRTR